MRIFKKILKWGGLAILVIVLFVYGYSEFLIKSAPGGRDVGLMTRVAENRFSSLFDEEVSALYAFLKARAELEMENTE